MIDKEIAGMNAIELFDLWDDLCLAANYVLERHMDASKLSILAHIAMADFEQSVEIPTVAPALRRSPRLRKQH